MVLAIMNEVRIGIDINRFCRFQVSDEENVTVGQIIANIETGVPSSGPLKEHIKDILQISNGC